MNSISKKKIKCKHGCGKAPAPQRLECYTCRSRLVNQRKPIDMMYYFLKKSAKKRYLPFEITLPWFKKFIEKKTDFMENRGRSGTSFTIDRIRNLEGYIVGNLQVLTKSQNSLKFHHEDLKRELGPQYEGDDMPF